MHCIDDISMRHAIKFMEEQGGSVRLVNMCNTTVTQFVLHITLVNHSRIFQIDFTCHHIHSSIFG